MDERENPYQSPETQNDPPPLGDLSPSDLFVLFAVVVLVIVLSIVFWEWRKY